MSDGDEESLETLLWHGRFTQKERRFKSRDLHFSMSVGGLDCSKGEIKGEMSASGYAWLLGSADVCCFLDDKEGGKSSSCHTWQPKWQQLERSLLNSFDKISFKKLSMAWHAVFTLYQKNFLFALCTTESSNI